VIAPRLSSRVGFQPIGQLWRDTIVELAELPSSDTIDLFTNRRSKIENQKLSVADALSNLPFAVITSITSSGAL
jgi:hypothetical protein